MARDIFKKLSGIPKSDPVSPPVPVPVVGQGIGGPMPVARVIPGFKSAPGEMASFVAERAAVNAEKITLRAERDHLAKKLEVFDGAIAARHIDPRSVVQSRFANRNPDSFLTDGFISLKAEIAASGGNVQPIKVRRLIASIDLYGTSQVEKALGSGDLYRTSRPAQDPVKADLYGTSQEGRGEPGVLPEFEIIFGSRRHRACLELGLPVLAMIVDATDDVSMFIEMERENRNREDLTPWEQATAYAMALREGIFSSARTMSIALNVDEGNVSKLLTMAKLPPTIVEAFPSALDLQYRWVGPLVDFVKRDSETILDRARKIKAQRQEVIQEGGVPEKANKVFSQLTAEPDLMATKKSLEIRVEGSKGASFKSTDSGIVTIKFSDTLSEAQQAMLIGLVETFLKKTAKIL